MDDSKRNKIIDDLLLKRPHGPKGRKYSDISYTDSCEYNYTTGREVAVCIPSDPCYGYGPETLFSLGFRSVIEVKTYVKNRWFAGKNGWEIGRRRSTITRRANRIWDRISKSVKQVSKEGRCGIYKVKIPHQHHTLGYIFGRDGEEAKLIINNFFPAQRNGYAISFVEIGSVKKLADYNASVKTGFEERVTQLQRQIKDAEEHIEAIRTQETMLTILENHQMILED